MAKILISSPSSFLSAPLPFPSRHGRLGFPLYRPRRAETRVRMSFQEIPPVDLHAIVSRAEGMLYTLADAAVAADPAAADGAVQKNGGWFGFISDAMEVVLKVATLPLTKQQVESTLAMQNLQPKIKAIQERYKGNQERIQLETSRLYKQAGVNPLAGCLPTLATIPVWIGLYQALSNVANEGLLTEGFFFGSHL